MENVLPVLIVIVPALLKLPPVVVRLALPDNVNLPDDVLVLKPNSALAPVWFWILAVVLPSVRLAALVTMFAPLNCRMPLTL